MYGPLGSAILSMRSSENLTSSDVSGSPLENFRSGLELADVRLRIRELAALRGVRLGLVAARRDRQQVLVHVADQLLGAEVVGPGRVQRRRPCRSCRGSRCRRCLRSAAGVALPPPRCSSSSSLLPHAAAPTASSAVQPNTAIRCARIFSAPLQWARVRPPPRPNLVDGRPAARRSSVETATRERNPTSQADASRCWCVSAPDVCPTRRASLSPECSARRSAPLLRMVPVIASMRCSR